jgi:EAL and modified HD-GYP domain-containing signal transduction protein
MQFHVARQPIFDRQQKVYAYELLYRSGFDNAFSGLDGDKATSEVITNSFLLIGLEALTRGKKAFINFPKGSLEEGIAALLPKEHAVIEILEDIEPDEKIIGICKKLKELGYTLALDDFIYDVKYTPLIELADIIKVDFLNTPVEERKNIIKTIGHSRVKFLAEKVETREELTQAIEWGYSYFQGYFFSKPVIISGRDIPGFKLTYFQLLRDINKGVIDFDQLEKLIKRDISLSFMLLKYINSSAFIFRSKIHSIKQALTLLGRNGVIQWFSLVALKSISEDKPNELIVTALSRAIFCELIAQKVGMKERSSDLFLMGMFSLIDAFLDQPLIVALQELPISDEIKNALLGEKSKFREVYDLILFYEKGEWEKIRAAAEKLRLGEEEVVEAYAKTLDMTNKIFIS